MPDNSTVQVQVRMTATIAGMYDGEPVPAKGECLVVRKDVADLWVGWKIAEICEPKAPEPKTAAKPPAEKREVAKAEAPEKRGK